jgi:hypothetical protein
MVLSAWIGRENENASDAHDGAGTWREITFAIWLKDGLGIT